MGPIFYILLIITWTLLHHLPEQAGNKESALPPDPVLAGLGWEKPDSCPFFSKHLDTGLAPKSCSFSPDGKTIMVTLLNQPARAVDVFSVTPFEKIRTLNAGGTDLKNDLNYAEGRFYMKDSTFWFTRMTTGEYFIYHSREDSLEKGRSTHGQWTKVVEFSPDNRYVAFSHWLSNGVSVFGTENHELVRDILTKMTPRGIAWIGNDTIAVASFDEGDIEAFSLGTGKLVRSIHEDRAAMRDVRFDSIHRMLYYDDMYHGRVYKYDWNAGKEVARLEVSKNPNSMKLDPDACHLFLSCRGPNNPRGYIYPSLENGVVEIIRTDSLRIVARWQQGNQPTGLDISADGRYLATTDFSAHRLNLYLIQDLREQIASKE